MNHSTKSFKAKPDITFYEHVLYGFDSFPAQNHVVSVAPSGIMPEKHVDDSLESSVGDILNLAWVHQGFFRIIRHLLY